MYQSGSVQGLGRDPQRPASQRPRRSGSPRRQRRSGARALAGSGSPTRRQGSDHQGSRRRAEPALAQARRVGSVRTSPCQPLGRRGEEPYVLAGSGSLLRRRRVEISRLRRADEAPIKEVAERSGGLAEVVRHSPIGLTEAVVRLPAVRQATGGTATVPVVRRGVCYGCAHRTRTFDGNSAGQQIKELVPHLGSFAKCHEKLPGSFLGRPRRARRPARKLSSRRPDARVVREVPAGQGRRCPAMSGDRRCPGAGRSGSGRVPRGR